MKKALRSTLIVLIAILTLAIATVAVNANDTNVTSVSINKDNVTLDAGASTGLAISYSYSGKAPSTDEINWESSNSSVATVDNGMVKANHAGKATVTVELEGKTDTCVIIVNNVAPTKKNTTAAYKQLNKYRKSKKLKALKRDKKLEKIALKRAKEMAESGKFSHTRPNGKSSLTLIKGRKAKGENIAMGQNTCSQVSKAWYASPGHRKNMLRKNFKKVGIAGYTLNGVTYWAQVFSS